ncbi:MAG TPA: AI-2E family transporter [Bryobacteraceae bacterium]|nr:AI-2E family transporter [Bryobacteraceae bacterium]
MATHPHKRHQNSNRSSIIILAGVILALYFGRDVFVPIVFAVLATVLLTPVVATFEKIHVPRPLAILLVLLALGAVLAGFVWTIGNEFVDTANDLPGYRENVRQKVDRLRRTANGAVGRAIRNVEEFGRDLDQSHPGNATPDRPAAGTLSRSKRSTPVPVHVVDKSGNYPTVVHYSLLALRPLGLIIITLAATSFMLLRRENLRSRLLRLAGADQVRVTSEALEEAATRVSRYLRLQLMVNVSFGVCIAGGLALIGLPHALLWGVIAGAFRFVPYVGVFTAASIPILVAFAASPDWWPPLAVLGLFVTLDLITTNAIEPLVYGVHTGVSELAILIAAVFWTVIWGPIGLLVSIPLTVCIVVLGRYFPFLSTIYILLSEEPSLSIEARVYQRLLRRDFEPAREQVMEFSRKNSAAETFDSALMPVLSLAESDRNRGLLDRNRFDFVLSSLREIGLEISCEECSNDSWPNVGNVRVVCVPAFGRADELGALLLARLLRSFGADAAHLSSAAARRVQEDGDICADIICVSAFSPFAFTHTGNINRRLRIRFPNAPIFAGIWGISKELKTVSHRFNGSPPDAVAPTLAAICEQIRACAITFREHGQVSEPGAKLAEI